jgi:hypothetical protein
VIVRAGPFGRGDQRLRPVAGQFEWPWISVLPIQVECQPDRAILRTWQPSASPRPRDAVALAKLKTLRCTPAMAAGVTTKLWQLSDMVKVLEDWEEVPKSI